jgi:hypothetical protein
MTLSARHARDPEQDGPARCVTTAPPASGEPCRTCGFCGRSLAGRRPRARYCSSGCRHRAWRQRVGCVRCRGRLVLDPTALALGALDDAVTLAACASLDAAGVNRVPQAQRARHRLAAQFRGHGGRDG